MSAPLPVYYEPACSSKARFRGRGVVCAGGRHAGSHIAIVDGEPVFWGPGLRRAS